MSVTQIAMKITTRQGSFIKQFGGPGDNNIICFKFWQAVVASGCPGACSYCFLQTQRPYTTPMVAGGTETRYDLMGTLFENLPDLEPQARRWLKTQKVPTAMIVGENQDGLAFEGPYHKEIGITPLEILIPLFTDENPVEHSLIVLSKFTSTQYAEAFGPSPNVIFSWSLSLPSISERYEKHVASLDARLSKAEAMRKAGYRIRFRLDALAPIEGWEAELRSVMQRINHVGPEMLTIGALRASNIGRLRSAATSNGRDASIFNYLVDGKDPSGFKHRTEEKFHVDAFRMINELRAPTIRLGLCKEDLSLWKATEIEWDGCHCLHNESDAVTSPRAELLQLTRNRV